MTAICADEVMTGIGGTADIKLDAIEDIAGGIRGRTAHGLVETARERLGKRDGFGFELRFHGKLLQLGSFDLLHNPARAEVAGDLPGFQSEERAGREPADEGL
jgi:hypothetical protein